MFGQAAGWEWECSAGPTAPHLPGSCSIISQSSSPCCYFLVLYLPAFNFRFLRLPYPSSPVHHLLVHCLSARHPVLHLPVLHVPASHLLVHPFPAHHLLSFVSQSIISWSIFSLLFTFCPLSPPAASPSTSHSSLVGTAAPGSRGTRRSPLAAPRPLWGPLPRQCPGRWWRGGTGGGPGHGPPGAAAGAAERRCRTCWLAPKPAW